MSKHYFCIKRYIKRIQVVLWASKQKNQRISSHGFCKINFLKASCDENFSFFLKLLKLLQQKFRTGIAGIPTLLIRALDASPIYHRVVALTICASTIVHVAGHISNNIHIVIAAHDTPANHTVFKLFKHLNFEAHVGDTWGVVGRIGGSVAFITGVVLCVVLLIIVVSSRESVRRTNFNFFWYNHNFFFVLFFVLLCTHGWQGFLTFQTNIEIHDPTACHLLLHSHTLHLPTNSTNHTDNNSTALSCYIPPEFESIPSDAWKWICVPLFVYLFERVIRLWRHTQSCTITQIIKHSSQVIEIQMQKRGFRSGVGEYAYLLCPNISLFEWHPYSLTSRPNEDSFTVHVRIVGDWTRKLFAICEAGGFEVEKCRLKLVCDGPYKSPTSNVVRYETVVCIGANIGVTPFVSMLKSFIYREPMQMGEINNGYKEEEGEDANRVQGVRGGVKKVCAVFLFIEWAQFCFQEC